jgi:ATP-dependent DNA helicase RecQ
MMEADELLLLLRVATGQDGARFRPGQREAIDAMVRARRRVLVAQPAGWGKGLACLLATHLQCRDGGNPTLHVSSAVLSTLEANRIGVIAADWNTATAEERARIRVAFTDGGVDLLVVSADRLASDGFLATCLVPTAARIGLLVLDDAHVCARDDPPHRRLDRALRLIPVATPLLATTPTADPAIVADLRTRLQLDLVVDGAWPA